MKSKERRGGPFPAQAIAVAPTLVSQSPLHSLPPPVVSTQQKKAQKQFDIYVTLWLKI